MNDKKQNPYYRSLDELHIDPTFLEREKFEFAEPASEIKSDDYSRRDFLKIMGFSATAIMGACTRMPVEKTIPYLVQPQNIVAGKPYWYASTCGSCTAHCGILVKTREGRPIKIEGNPDSLVSGGGLCAVGQASVLELYDSNRLTSPLHDGKACTWQTLDNAVLGKLKAATENNRAIRLVTGTITSPTTKNLISAFLTKYPTAKHIAYDACSASALIAAHETLFGKKVLPHFHFDEAKIIVGIGADFLGTWISPVEFARAWAKNRRLKDKTMSRHVQFESNMTITGANADERIAVSLSEQKLVVLSLLNECLRLAGFAAPTSVASTHQNRISQLARELMQNKGRSLVVCGVNDIHLQTIVAGINHVLQNYGTTIDVNNASNQKMGNDSDFKLLVTELTQGQVEALIFVDVNPLYDWPDSIALAAGIKKTPLAVSVTQSLDETARACHFIATKSHFLEEWNDAEPVASQFQLAQPVINTLFDTRSFGDSLLKWNETPGTYLEAIKTSWRETIFSKQSSQLFFEPFWQSCVQKGVYNAAHGPATSVTINDSVLNSAALALSDQSKVSAKDFEITTYESVALRDGAKANNPWLQELPDPITKATWDNYFSVNPSDATKLAIKDGDIVTVGKDNKSLTLPVIVQPGQALGTVSVALGYGRESAGRVGTGIGGNAYNLTSMQSTFRDYSFSGAVVSKTGKHKKMALTQTHYSMEKRPLVKETTLAAYKSDEASGNKDSHDLVMLWQQHETKGPSYGMAIDLNACIGCSGCLVGCQAENNVPVVGRDEVANQREMSWIRLDRYYSGDVNNPEVVFQPMMCQHCGNAPCESVCPVLATVHSSDGLNQQVYNRCVGTRYCANNCPYKVRRFNWFDYAGNAKFDYHLNNDKGRLALNPDIVVRSRGVMEKCSMCIQRIQEEKNLAAKEGRKVDADNIKTACQQSCPTDAIVFGDLNDAGGKLMKFMNGNKRRYQVLAELNVKPHVNYLTKVRNK